LTSGTGARPNGRDLRIIVENSEYWLLNMGDLAMLDVTLRRLRARFPEARIGVLTDTPGLLRAYFPGTEPIVPHRTSAWSPIGPLGRVCELLGPRVVGPVAIGWMTVRLWLPQKARGARRRVRRLLRSAWARLRPAGTPSAVVQDEPVTPAAVTLGRLTPTAKAAAASSSLVVALGGGYLTDADPWQSHRLLNLLEHAVRRGVPTAMIGQGIGPIDDPALTARAADVLPGVDVIALREGRRGPVLVERAGVPASRVAVTGDDAIELAYCQHPQELGGDIGICLRIAGYAPVATAARAAVAASLRSCAAELDAGLTPVIIAEYRSQDRRSTLPLVEGFEAARRPLARFARPQEVAGQVGRCRVMVTGAYHAAVFALSQGIPVVALTSSTYYDDKFLGLAGMFGTGLELIRLDGSDLGERLSVAIRSAWKLAPARRPVLLASAAEQIELSRRSFDRVCSLV
jgi:polysaccharide pyruvyl transferase WcaK-like protein